MPITINDCRKCGRPPGIWTTAEDGRPNIMIFCHNGHFNEVEADTVIGAIVDWNYDNRPKEEHGED